MNLVLATVDRAVAADALLSVSALRKVTIIGMTKPTDKLPVTKNTNGFEPKDHEDMKLGIMAGYSPSHMELPLDGILEAEKLGYDSVWTAEAWGSDAVTPAAWILARTSTMKVGTAIMQMPARTPACAAMTAMTLDRMSGGRFILGIGPSGPQVIEGWHGVPYGKPITRTKEYISIVRKILSREDKLHTTACTIRSLHG